MRILKQPIAKWEKALKRLSASPEVGPLQSVEADLAALIQRAALLHCYVSYRYNSGYGEKSHHAASKHAMRKLIKIRKVLDYSYPKDTNITL